MNVHSIIGLSVPLELLLHKSTPFNHLRSFFITNAVLPNFHNSCNWTQQQHIHYLLSLAAILFHGCYQYLRRKLGCGNLNMLSRSRMPGHHVARSNTSLCLVNQNERWWEAMSGQYFLMFVNLMSHILPLDPEHTIEVMLLTKEAWGWGCCAVGSAEHDCTWVGQAVSFRTPLTKNLEHIINDFTMQSRERSKYMDEVGKAEETAIVLTERSIILCVVIPAQLTLQRVPISSAAWCSCHSHHS